MQGIREWDLKIKKSNSVDADLSYSKYWSLQLWFSKTTMTNILNKVDKNVDRYEIL